MIIRKSSLRGRVSRVSRRFLIRLLGRTGQDRLLDVTDSRPPSSRTPWRQRQRLLRRSGSGQLVEIGGGGGDPFGVHHPSSRIYDSFGTPLLAPISRTTDGRFVLDKDSEEGGFTSPRKPIRIFAQVGGPPPVIQVRRTTPPYGRWTLRSVGGPYYDHLRPPYHHHHRVVEGGVYDVRAGTTHALVHRPEGGGSDDDHRLVGLRRGDDGTFTIDSRLSLPSPEFGRHAIAETFVRSPRFLRDRVRSSSPRQFVDSWKQLSQLASFSELSSVRQPSSVERSFPSTILSSLHASLQKTPSTVGTPLNAAALLREQVNAEYERVIQEQEYLLEKNKFLLRQQEMRVPSQLYGGTPMGYDHHQRQIDPRYSKGGALYYPDYVPAWMSPRGPLYLPPPPPHRQPRYEAAPSSPMYHHHHHHPPYRESLFIVPDSAMTTPPPPQYVNVSSLPRRGVRPPYYLLNPPPPLPLPPPPPPPTTTTNTPLPEAVKPLATSSPPAVRARRDRRKVATTTTTRGKTSVVDHQLKSSSSSSSAVAAAAAAVVVDSSIESDFLGDGGRLLFPGYPSSSSRSEGVPLSSSSSKFLLGRPHSAPNFTSSLQSDVSFGDPSTSTGDPYRGPYPPLKGSKGGTFDQSTDQSHEKSEDEFSPSSSSGFGSKNTSQQQSSSQSGQSASALGLDASRLDDSSGDAATMKPTQGVPEFSVTREGRRYTQLGVNVMDTPHHHQQQPQYPGPYDFWVPQQPTTTMMMMDPQGRHTTGSFAVPPGNLLLGIPPTRPSPPTFQRQLPPLPPSRPALPSPLYQNTTAKGVTEVMPTVPITSTTRKGPVTRHNAPVAAPASLLPPAMALDISVDDHYEFDTLLSPVPEEESDSFWLASSNSALLEEGQPPPSTSSRGGGDDVVGRGGGRHGAARGCEGGDRKDEHESMEARVAAMKEEFHQYRQRQAKKRSDRGGGELESAC